MILVIVTKISLVGMRTDRQTHTYTGARDHNTFRVVYDSREM